VRPAPHANRIGIMLSRRRRVETPRSHICHAAEPAASYDTAEPAASYDTA